MTVASRVCFVVLISLLVVTIWAYRSFDPNPGVVATTVLVVVGLFLLGVSAYLEWDFWRFGSNKD